MDVFTQTLHFSCLLTVLSPITALAVIVMSRVLLHMIPENGLVLDIFSFRRNFTETEQSSSKFLKNYNSIIIFYIKLRASYVLIWHVGLLLGDMWQNIQPLLWRTTLKPIAEDKNSLAAPEKVSLSRCHHPTAVYTS